VTKSNKMRQQNSLTGPQEIALQALLEGKTVTRAAEAAGVARQTVSRWLHEDETFVAEFNRRRAEIWDAGKLKMIQLIEAAVAALERALQSENEGIRLRAAQWILDRTLGNLSPPMKLTDPEEIRKRREQQKAWDELFDNLLRLDNS